MSSLICFHAFIMHPNEEKGVLRPNTPCLSPLVDSHLKVFLTTIHPIFMNSFREPESEKKNYILYF